MFAVFAGVVGVGAVADGSGVGGDAESVVSAGVAVETGVVAIRPDAVGVEQTRSRRRVGAVGVEDVAHGPAKTRFEQNRR